MLLNIEQIENVEKGKGACCRVFHTDHPKIEKTLKFENTKLKGKGYL